MWAVAYLKNPKTETKTNHPRNMAKSRVWTAEIPETIVTNFACWAVM